MECDFLCTIVKNIAGWGKPAALSCIFILTWR